MLVLMITVKGRRENDMMLSCNRFAFIPHLCLECKRYIWLEGYRRAKVWKKSIDMPIKENICKDCLTKFDVGLENEREKK